MSKNHFDQGSSVLRAGGVGRLAGATALAAGLLVPLQVQAAEATLADCQRAVQGEVWSTGHCLATDHFMLITPKLDSNLLIEHVDADAIRLTARTAVSARAPAYGDNSPNVVMFGPNLALLVSNQYEVDHLDATALGKTDFSSYENGVGQQGSTDLVVHGSFSFAKGSLESYLTPTPAPWYGPANIGGSAMFGILGSYSRGYKYDGTIAYENSSTDSIASYSIDVSVRAIPEPSSWALMGLGLLGLSLVRRRPRA